jgi:N-acetylglucosamine-6-sulfatase
MRRHHNWAATPLAAAAAAVALLGLAQCGDAPAREERRATAVPRGPQTQPNIVVLETDDQRQDEMGVMPKVRRLLAAQGTTFDNSLASYPLCCPSRATFLTGQYAHNHGVLHNDPPTGGVKKLKADNTLPVWLSRAGYHTALVGKYLSGYGEDGDPEEIPPGWSDWNASLDPSTYGYYRTTLNRNGRLTTTGTDPGSYQTDVYARLASEIVRRRAPSPQPFFLWVTFLAPHAARGEGSGGESSKLAVPAPRHRGRFTSAALPASRALNEADVSDKPKFVRRKEPLTPQVRAGLSRARRARLESLLAVDDAAARIVSALQASGELGRTLIIFTSDNGYMQGEHRIDEGKIVHYEPSTRVPLIVRGPGVPRGARRRQLVANVDLAPTILAAARARPGLAMDGRSLLPLAADPDALAARDILLEARPDKPVRQYAAVRTRRYVYVEYGNGDRELYDLRRDPLQLVSRHDDPAYARVRIALSRRLAVLRDCRGSACARGAGSR